MNHYFDVDVATKYNVNIAIFLNNLAHWTVVNIANRSNYHDFRYWTYNSRRAFLELFPYWTDDQLRTIISNAIKADLVIEGSYNQKAYDKTKWYSLSDKALLYYKITPTPPSHEKDNSPYYDSSGKNPKSSPEPFGQNPKGQFCEESKQTDKIQYKKTLQPAPVLIGEKSPIDVGEIPNGLGENPQPIPDSKPDEKPTTTTRDQILNNHPHSEPVVVSSASLTSTPKVNPQNLVNLNRPGITDKLLTAYRSTPIMRGNIMCEGDFLSAAYFSIDTRDKLTTTEQQRANGICGLVRRGEFDEPAEWGLKLKRLRDRESGAANASLQEIESAKKAILDPTVKGREAALAKMVAMGLQFKAATEKKPCYADKVISIDSRPKKIFSKIELPEQGITDEYMQPDMELLAEIKAAEEENSVDVWEARL